MHKTLKLIATAACIYMVLGVSGGLFYREFTEGHNFPEGKFTQLGVVHTHLLALGLLVMLIVLVLEKVFELSRHEKLFNAFFWLYNAGVLLTTSMMVWHGILTVLGHEGTKAISGMAGMGHILVTVALIIFFVNLFKSLGHERRDRVEHGATKH